MIEIEKLIVTIIEVVAVFVVMVGVAAVVVMMIVVKVDVTNDFIFYFIIILLMSLKTLDMSNFFSLGLNLTTTFPRDNKYCSRSNS